MKFWMTCAVVGFGVAAAATGRHAKKGNPRGDSQPVEALIASVKLGEPAPLAFRCPKAEARDIETTHEFHATGPVFLIVTTACPKVECRSENERTVVSVGIDSRPEGLKNTCPLPSGVSLTTSRGLQLGASSAEVERLYGKPAKGYYRKGVPDNFHYSGRLGKLPIQFFLTFAAGRVESMSVFVNEDGH